MTGGLIFFQHITGGTRAVQHWPPHHRLASHHRFVNVCLEGFVPLVGSSRDEQRPLGHPLGHPTGRPMRRPMGRPMVPWDVP